MVQSVFDLPVAAGEIEQGLWLASGALRIKTGQVVMIFDHGFEAALHGLAGSADMNHLAKAGPSPASAIRAVPVVARRTVDPEFVGYDLGSSCGPLFSTFVASAGVLRSRAKARLAKVTSVA